MDVALLLEVAFSFGERQQALSFARQLARAGHRAHFVVTEPLASHVRFGGFEPRIFASPADAAEILRDVDPALVIGCELFNLSPALVETLVASRRPLATLDGTTLGAELHADPFGVPVFQRAVVLPAHCVVLRPCPVSDVAADTGKLLHWRAFPSARRIAKEAAPYAALGLDPARRTVLLPIAVWATHFTRLAQPPFEQLAGHHERLVARIVAGLAAAREAIDLVVVSDLPRTRARIGDVAIHQMGLLPYAAYDHLLQSCDALVSDNIVQASLARAVVAGTPHLAIHNEAPYPSNMFPIRHLFPRERAFAACAEVATFEDPAEIRDKLAAILARGYADEARRARRAAYLEQVAALPEAGDVVARIAGSP